MAARVAVSLVLLSLVLLLASERVVVRSESTEDKMALLDFESKVPHVRNLNWNANTSACDWVGVKCNAERERVIELRLPAVGLYGEIPSGTVGRLSELRVLSLRSNRLSGQLPGDLFTNTPFLRSVYLQNNLFSGPLPQTFTSTRISRLDLSFNGFNSSIPFSFNSLTQLSLLYLQNNSLVSTIPNLNLPNLKFLNLSNNRLNGSIPRSLDRFGRSSFTGNAGLCGAPLAECRPFFLAPAPAPENPAVLRNKKKKLSTGALAAVIVGAAALLFLILACLLLLCTKRRTAKASREGVGVKKSDLPGTAVEKGGAGKDEYPASSSQEAERNKLVFFEGSAYSFDLEDLLRASAEVLGKGSVGTSYKAVLEDGTTVVVKRLKDVVATRKDFEQQMDLVGNIRHSNLLPLRAFYYSKDEKLLVYDYIPNGSLSAVLHGGNRGAGRTPLDWDTRMRIAMGAAKGIAHIHSSGGGKFTHGNIKSSNILLTAGETSCLVSDFGLVGLFSAAAAANRIAGYRAPEVLETRKVTQKSDVYSFGVLLLELLTGKSPTQASLNDESIDLPRWVQSVVREEWTAEVFDVDLMRYQNIEEEMVQLLQIAMACVAASPDQRPSMADVLKMMRQMRPEYDSPSSDPNNNNNNTNIRSSNDDNKAGAPAPPPSASAAVASSSSS